MRAPIISRIYDDPARMKGSFKKAEKEIEKRFSTLSKKLNAVVLAMLQKLAKGKLKGNVKLNLFEYDFSINAELWEYDLFTASNLARLSEDIQELLDNFLYGSSMIEEDFFLTEFIELAADKAAHDVYANLAAQSEDYAAVTTVKTVLQSQAYSDVVLIAASQSLDDWKSLAGDIKRKVQYLITEGAAAGVSPRELAKEIAQEGIPLKKAKSIARTEMIGAYRKARIAEAERYKEKYGTRSKYMWLSALSPTTRRTHAKRHGKLYTKEEIAEFYRKDGNSYNCQCSFVEILVDDEGKPRSPKLTDRMNKQRKSWVKKLKEQGNAIN